MNRSGILFLIAVFVLLALAVPVFAQETGVYRGRVLDVSGAPVAGAEIFVYRSDDTRGPADFISAGTEKNGAFEITLPVGRYWAVARFREGRARFGPLMPGDRHSGEPLAITVTAEGAPEDDFVVADLREAALLMRKTDATFYAVKGRILGTDGRPLANAYAYAHTSSELTGVPAYLSPWTDDSGSYTLFLPGGEYYVGQAKEFPPVPTSIHHDRISLDRDIDGLDIVNEN